MSDNPQSPNQQPRSPGAEKKSGNEGYDQSEPEPEPDSSFTPSPEAATRSGKSSKSQNPSTEAIQKAIGGFEEKIDLHGCRHEWSIMLVSANLNKDDEAVFDTKEVRRFLVKITQALKVCEKFNLASISEPDRLQTLYRKLENVKEQGKILSRSNQTTSELVKETYVGAIPWLLILMETILKVLFTDEGLHSDALGEIIDLADLGQILCQAASHWTPRPASFRGQGILESTRNAIRPSLRTIAERYRKAKRSLDEAEEYALRRRLLQERREKRLEQGVSWLDAKRAELLERKQMWQEQVLTEPVEIFARTPTSPKIFDIDDVVLPGGPNHETAAPADTTVSSFGVPVPARPTREPTEEIPGPAQSAWKTEEMIALLNGLQHFTGQGRFVKIFAAHGGPDGALAQRDLDELVQQAKFVKQSMAAQLDHGLDKSWDWLRSVPE